MSSASRVTANLLITTNPSKSDTGPAVAVKDVIDVRGMPTTAGSRVLPQVPARRDATVVARVRAAGATIVGKTNLDEWAFDTTGANPHYGVVVNPHDPKRIPGGSSGACAAAVVLGLCDWAIGTDTAGSIRIPAALCGVVGIKPTTGLLPTDGIYALSPTLDTPGPLAADVTTAAAALEMMVGESSAAPTAGGSHRIGAPAGWVNELDAGVDAAWSTLAASLPEIPFPDRQRFGGPFEAIVFAEAAARHRTWLTARAGDYGDATRASLRMGFRVSAVDYLAALDERQRLADEIDAALDCVDAIVLPGSSCVAPPHEETGVRERLGRFTTPFSLTGHPVVALPVPVSDGSLPVGAQVVARRGQDSTAVAVAAQLEREWKTGHTQHARGQNVS